VFGIIPSDVGRPLMNFNPDVEIPQLKKMVEQAIEGSPSKFGEVKGRDGARFELYITPCLTTDNKVDGAAIVLAEVRPEKLIKSAAEK
jgi:two-component system, chemotaxis family, CheB/CheR fusion protein